MPGSRSEQKVTKKMYEYYDSLSFEDWITFLNKNQKGNQLKELLKMSLTDYSDLEKDIENAQEPKTLPRGSEVKARIISVRDGISDKNGAQWYMPVFDVPDDPMVLEFSDFFWDLKDRDKLDEKAFQRAVRKFKMFAEAVGLDYSKPFSWTDDLVGLTAWVILGVRKSDEYGEQNTISKYITGK